MKPAYGPEWARHDATAADGARLAYWSAGDGDPLLLIAGQAVDHGSWQIVGPALLPGRRVIIFDHRGIGESESGEAERFTTRLFADDAVRILDAAGADRADVLGHSMGGRVAQWLAVDHGDRLRRLALVSTSAGDARGSRRSDAADRAIRSSDPRQVASVFWDADRQDLVRLLAVGRDRTALARHHRASRKHDALAALGGVTTPTLVLHGEHDELTPVDHARILAAAIPRARLTVVKDARHGIVLDGGLGLQIADRFLRRPPRTSDPAASAT
ncbi:alpha/beta fold hydrolase [Microbacterium oryzae]|uniref:alpha/beta fold hydrolase n=1 Tax=Microbacterium oryzae TaxID=743009 RepID=UPI0025AFACAE|nr:alpha/beta fold hydrolase [Microbacterium oryzae]MDN3311096.1 alpha/beta fold hydrolase [Microbacterium oryzae]